MREQAKAAPGRLARAGKILPALLGTALLGGCDMVVMNPAGDVAMQQRDLILLATGLMLLIIVPVMALTVLFAWRYRAGRGATYDPKFDHSMSLELVIWSLPLLIIIVLGAVTWTSTHLLDPFRPLDRIAPGRPVPAGTRPLEVQVVALDWKWLFILPEQGIATVNELALPVDVPVRFSITSSAQMSTFYAPTLAGMIYAMPGMRSEMNAVLNRAGDSWGFSGNYTGSGHSHMRFLLRGMDRAGFDRWVEEARGGQALTAPEYLALERPSERVPVMRFGSVEAGLFDRALNGCVEPRRPCASEVMAGDRARGGGDPGHQHIGSGMPSARGGAHGHPPVPALLREPEEKGSGPNVTAPVGPVGPGLPTPRN